MTGVFVHDGEAFAVPTPPRLPGARPGRGLSGREWDVLHGISAGMSNAEIGAAHGVSEDTIKTTVRRLYRKLKVNDRAHAVAQAFRAGLLT